MGGTGIETGQQRVSDAGIVAVSTRGLRPSGIRTVASESGEQGIGHLVADRDEPVRWPGAVCHGVVRGGIFYGKRLGQLVVGSGGTSGESTAARMAGQPWSRKSPSMSSAADSIGCPVSAVHQVRRRLCISRRRRMSR